MTKARYQARSLEAPLTAEVKQALLNASFNGRSWTIPIPSGEATEAIIAFKLASFVRGDMVVTLLGLNVRAIIARSIAGKK